MQVFIAFEGPSDSVSVVKIIENLRLLIHGIWYVFAVKGEFLQLGQNSRKILNNQFAYCHPYFCISSIVKQVRQACRVLLLFQWVQVKQLESLFIFAIQARLLDWYLGCCDWQTIAGIFAGHKWHQNIYVLDVIVLSFVLRPKIFWHYCNLCYRTLVDWRCTDCCLWICISRAYHSAIGTQIIIRMWPNSCCKIRATSQSADIFSIKTARLNRSFSVYHFAFLSSVVFIVALGRDYFLTVYQTPLLSASPFVIVYRYFIFITTKVTDCDFCIGLSSPVSYKLRYTVFKFWFFSPASWGIIKHHASSGDY